MVDNTQSSKADTTATSAAYPRAASTQQVPLETAEGWRCLTTESTTRTPTQEPAGVEPAEAVAETSTAKRSRRETGITATNMNNGSDDHSSWGRENRSGSRVAGGGGNAVTRSDNLAILEQTKAEIGEALVQCEELVGTLEEELLARLLKVMSMMSMRGACS